MAHGPTNFELLSTSLLYDTCYYAVDVHIFTNSRNCMRMAFALHCDPTNKLFHNHQGLRSTITEAGAGKNLVFRDNNNS